MYKTLDYEELKNCMHALIEVRKHNYKPSAILANDMLITALAMSLPDVGASNQPVLTIASVDPSALGSFF